VYFPIYCTVTTNVCRELFDIRVCDIVHLIRVSKLSFIHGFGGMFWARKCTT